jgi:hypothetical protein
VPLKGKNISDFMSKSFRFGEWTFGRKNNRQKRNKIDKWLWHGTQKDLTSFLWIQNFAQARVLTGFF